jgi:hypothetical protein
MFVYQLKEWIDANGSDVCVYIYWLRFWLDLLGHVITVTVS